ncbi:sugar ABC transporter ATP-binding protein [Pacificibacter marinus]|uniref:sugar ABC transporter ATP-binding protein n=1 Tax=Pacificibacter marinus TaxID=658057 RepID=UPI001C07AB46|nr:sugar ABC transporter ATP-binding protein [Pacificibacter marinus]MBU2868302.1 sugar ABC transporter ATP-binding protein [Pacificibacter marinus]
MSLTTTSVLREQRVSGRITEMRLDQIGMSFSGISVLRDVNVNFTGGEIHTLMGENGAGKSTLVKIISGVQCPTSGSMYIDGKPVSFASPREAEKLGIVIMHQELSLIPDMTVAENVMLGHEPLKFGLKIDRVKLRETAKAALARFGFTLDVDTRVRDLRVGEQQLVEIARALLMDARVLIMDEPTSALSQNETDILMEVVRDLAFQGVAVIYISHRMDEVFEISDRVTVLRDGNQIGSKLVSDTTPADLVHMMVGRPVDIQPVVRQTVPTQVPLMRVKGLTVRAAGREVLSDVSFTLHKGEVLGVGGLLGAGRTELVETLFGARGGAYEGIIEIDGEIVRPTTPKDGVAHGLALITEDRKGNGLILSDSIADNIALPLMPLKSRFGLMSNKLRMDQSLSTIEQLRIAANGPDHIVGKLSGGNQQKVVLGKWLATNPRILLLDEPTRGIDIGAKDEIYDLVGKLADQGLSVIFTSSELSEFVAVCDRVIVLSEGHMAGELMGEDITNKAVKDLAMQVHTSTDRTWKN